MTTTTPCAADLIVDSLKFSITYAGDLVQDVSEDQFTHMPHPTMNHPAFCLGHLSIYPNRIFELLGHPEGIVEKDGFAELFKAGVECVPQDGRYPGKDEILGHYVERHEAAIPVIAAARDEQLLAPNPAEGRFREMFPTIGSVTNFLMNTHQLLHLGQISAWRRATGLPSVR